MRCFEPSVAKRLVSNFPFNPIRNTPGGSDVNLQMAQDESAAVARQGASPAPLWCSPLWLDRRRLRAYDFGISFRRDDVHELS
jgi:hypothetical protein